MAWSSSSAMRWMLPLTWAWASALANWSSEADLAGGGVDDVRAADEHVGVLPRHDDEIREGGRVGGAAGAGAGDDRDLRDHAGEQHVAEEDLAVAGKGVDAFLDAGAAGVVDADDGHAGLDGEVEQVADFLGVDAADGAAADGEVLGEGGDLAAIDDAGGADDAVTGHLAFFQAEIGARMVGVHAELDEGAAVEECGEALAGGEQAFFVAFFDAVDAAADEGFLAAEFECLQVVICRWPWWVMFRTMGSVGGRAGRTR